MRSVGVREFRDHAALLMGAGETLVIERRGEPIGFFVPITDTDTKGRRTRGRLGVAVDELLDGTGVTEDELIDAIVRGLRRP